MNSLISPDNTWALLGVIFVLAALSMFLESRYRWARAITTPGLSIILAIIVANVGLVPTDAPVYDMVWSYIVPLAIPLLLFRGNLIRIIKKSGKLFAQFHFAALGTIVGAIVCGLLFGAFIPEGRGILSTLVGSYTGGAVNVAALKVSLDVGENTISSMLVADNLVMALAFVLMSIIPTRAIFQKWYSHKYIDLAAERAREAEARGEKVASVSEQKKETSALDMMMALAAAIVIVAVSTMLAGFVNDSGAPTWIKIFLGQRYLLMTALSVILVTAFPKFFDKLSIGDELGNLCVNVFFVVLGLPASFLLILQKTPIMFAVCGIMAAINMIFSLLGGKLIKSNVEDCMVASNATLGGPTTAAAYVKGMGWPELIAPAVLIGVWGYIVGNWLGILTYNYLLPFMAK